MLTDFYDTLKMFSLKRVYKATDRQEHLIKLIVTITKSFFLLCFKI